MLKSTPQPKKKPQFKKYIFPLGLLFILVLRAIEYITYLKNYQIYLFSDDAVYASLTKHFLNGDFLGAVNPYWNPGFPFFSIPFFLIFHDPKFAQVVLSATTHSLLSIVTYWFFQRYSKVLAVLATLICAFSAGFQKLVLLEGVTEPLYILFFWIGLLLGFLSLEKQKYWMYVLTGIVFGLAFFTRTDVSFLFLAFICFNGIHTLLGKSRKLFTKRIKLALIQTIIVSGSFLVVNIPYIYIQSIHLGKFTISGKYAYFGSGPPYNIEPDSQTTFAQDVWSIDYPNYHSKYYNSTRAFNSIVQVWNNGSFVDFTKKSFGESLKLYRSENSDNFFQGIELFLALTGLGLGLILTKFRKMTFYFLVIFLAGLLWTSAFMAPLFRYLSFGFPIFFYLEALAIYSLAQLVAKFFLINKKWFSYYAISSLVTVILTGSFIINNNDFSSFDSPPTLSRYSYHKIIGDWLKQNSIKLIGGRREGISTYADAKLVYIPSAPPDQIVKYMKEWGVEYIVIQEDDTGYSFVKPIAEPSYQNPDLKLIHQFSDGTLVWKVNLTDQEKKMNERVRVWQHQK